MLGAMVLFLKITAWLGGSEIQCAFLKYTGYFCPGCGGTRCANALKEGHITQAWGHNAMLTLAVFFFILGSFYLIIRITVLGKPPPQYPQH